MIILSDFQEPTSVIRHQQINTKAVLDQRVLGVGTLYITESELSWQGPLGFSIDYPHIALHALSKDLNLYPSECLYLQIDKHVDLPGFEPVENADHNEDDSDNESSNDVCELILVPEDLTSLPLMYNALKDCQELHPDPMQDVSTDEDEAFEDMIEEGYEDEVAVVADENIHNLRNLIINNGRRENDGQDEREMDEDQFVDAD